MKPPVYAPFPWRMEVLAPGHIAIIAADGGVLLSDETGEGDVTAALYAVHAANAYAGLIEACRLAQACILRLGIRLSDVGAYGLPEDLSGHYNGTGEDGVTVKALKALWAVLTASEQT
jgi:hypothetical protein